MNKSVPWMFLIIVAVQTITVSSAEGAISFCPTKTEIHIWEPCAFNLGIIPGSQLDARIHQTSSAQGYTTLVRRQDLTNDTSYDDCIRSRWDDFDVNCGVLLVHSHGGVRSSASFVAAAYSKDETVLFNPAGGGWADSDSNGSVDFGMFVAESTAISGQHYVGITRTWFENSWFRLQDNMTIAVISACDSAKYYQESYSILDALNTQAAFGYRDCVLVADMGPDVSRLFGLMNGNLGSGNCRKAGDAYAAGGYSEYFLMIGSTDSTLCPAPADFNPGNDGSGGPVGTAYINLDSFIEGVGPVGDSVLKVDVSQGNCEISDKKFEPSQSSEDPLNRSRQVRFTYKYKGDLCNPAYTITVTAKAAGIKAWGGGGQQMDGDKSAPNGDDVTWSFHY